MVEALAELERVAATAAVLPPALVALHRELLPLLWSGPPGVMLDAPSLEHRPESLPVGVPLLRVGAVKCGPSLAKRLQRVVELVGKHQPGPEIERLREAVRKSEGLAAELVPAVLREGAAGAHTRAEARGLEPGVTASALRFALFPDLARISAELAGPGEWAGWRNGYCPVCGSWPLLAEFRGLEQLRWLRCALCAANWSADRLLCVACGERDHRRLGYLAPEGKEAAGRAATCDTCRTYVKTVSSLAPLSAPRLLVADLATLPLDLIAMERGYSPPL